jgi:hypothetical protein
MAIHLGRPLPSASRDRPERLRGTRMPAPVSEVRRAVPIWSCSRWGLPCRPRCRRRGALLPHRFTLAGGPERPGRRSVLCGTVPGVAPAGRYPAPCFRGARTFLPRRPQGDKGGHPTVWLVDRRRCSPDCKPSRHLFLLCRVRVPALAKHGPTLRREHALMIGDPKIE